MLGANYHFTILDAQGKRVVALHTRTATLLFLLVLVLVLGFGAGYQMVRYTHVQDMLAEQHALAALRGQLSSAVLSRSAQLRNMEYHVGRIKDFNTKLRVMLAIGSPVDARTALAHDEIPGRGMRLLPVLLGRNYLRNLGRRADSVYQAMLSEEIQQQRIVHAVSEQMENLATIPVIVPTQGRFSSPFGWRTDPFTGGRRFHKGIDITARTGTPVRVTANGVVEQAAHSPSYGLVIVVRHSDTLRTRYAHLSKFVVAEGQRVLRGQVIGRVGNTGRSVAPHLHYEVHLHNKPVNPRNYILQ